MICRFLCGCFLHITLVSEGKQAFKIMRYSLNHSWKFQSWCTAYMIGLSQFTMILSVEIVNLVVLLTSPSVMDTVMNFLALVIIADFDDYMFAVVSDGPIGKLITDGEFDFSYI